MTEWQGASDCDDAGLSIWSLPMDASRDVNLSDSEMFERDALGMALRGQGPMRRRSGATATASAGNRIA